MQEILSNEGGTPVLTNYAVEIGDSLWSAIYEYIWNEFGPNEDYSSKYSIDGIFEDGDQKFVILRNRKDLTYYRLNFSLTEENGFVPDETLQPVAPDFKPVNSQFTEADIEAYEVAFAADHKIEEEKPVEEPVLEFAAEETPVAEEETKEEESAPPVEYAAEEEPVVESHENEEQPVTYNLEEVVEYQELLAKYGELESQVAELNNTIQTLTAERDNLLAQNNELTEFKLKIDREKKQELINSFYMLSDDLKKDCVDNIDTYSMDEIEAKLSVICVRNKVSFDLAKPEEAKPMTYNIDSVEDDDMAGLPAWVVRVKEVEKQNKL